LVFTLPFFHLAAMETHDLTAENYGKNTESPLQLVKLG
jgi:hypothetical protein